MDVDVDVDVDVERRKRDEARNTARQMRDFVIDYKNEWMAATATERRGDACADPQGKCRREAKGPPLPLPLPLRYALDPHSAAPQCQSANHVSHPAPVHAANSSSTSWGRAAQPWSSA